MIELPPIMSNQSLFEKYNTIYICATEQKGVIGILPKIKMT